MKAILNNIPDLAWIKDREGRFVAVNEPFARAGSREPEHIVGKSDFDIWPQHLAEAYRADDREVMTSGRGTCSGLEQRVVMYNRKYPLILGIPEALMAEADYQTILDYVLGEMREPEAFRSSLAELVGGRRGQVAGASGLITVGNRPDAGGFKAVFVLIWRRL